MAEPTWVIEYQPVPDEAAIRADERRKVAEEIARALEAKAGHRCPECGGKPGSVKHAPGAGWGSAATSRCGAGHTWRGPNHHIAVHAAAEIARTFGSPESHGDAR